MYNKLTSFNLFWQLQVRFKKKLVIEILDFKTWIISKNVNYLGHEENMSKWHLFREFGFKFFF